MKCPQCGRFLKKCEASVNSQMDIQEVTGICSKHGEVHPTDWEYEDFFPQPVAGTASEGK